MRRAGYGWGDFVNTVPTNPIDLDEIDATHRRHEMRRKQERCGKAIGLTVLLVSTVCIVAAIYVLFFR